jgi:hypothetical protein
MRWFRANRRLGGRVALFALALQLVLSFGHIHREDIYGYRPQSFAAAALPADKSAPAGHPSNQADDYCAICATLSLLNNSFIADAPQLAVLFVSHAVVHVDRVAVAISAPRHRLFQSRAPPLA